MQTVLGDVGHSRADSRTHALVVSLVHPDFLAPIYSISRVLQDEGFDVHVFSFSSPAGTRSDVSDAFTMHDCGPHAGSATQRWKKRRKLAAMVENWAAANKPSVIFASCPFSFLLGRRISGHSVPVVYVSFEVYEPRLAGLLRSPATTMRNWRARRALEDAAVVCAPSPERAEWLRKTSRLSREPVVLLNAPYGQGASATAAHDTEVRERLLPAALRSKRLVLHTGKVSATQGVLELVQSVEAWPDDAALVITRIGDDSYCRAVRDAASRSTKSDSIALLPMLSRPEMLKLQSAADIGVCLLRTGANLSASLPAPNKIGEYLHAGLFVLGTKSSSLEELERRGVACTVASLAPSEIAAAVTAALQQSGGSGAKRRISQAVASWYRMEVQLEPVLNTLRNQFGLPLSPSQSSATSAAPVNR